MSASAVAALVGAVGVVAGWRAVCGVGPVVADARVRRRVQTLRPGETGDPGPVWAAVVGAASRVAPVVARMSGAPARSARRADRALPELLGQVTRQLRSGSALSAALSAAAAGSADPDARAMGEALAAGVPLTRAVERWRGDDPTPARALASAALALATEAGGSVAAVLDGVTDTLRDRVALDREVAALSSQARMSAVVLVVAPVVFSLLAAGADPRVAEVLLGSPLGWACVAGGVALDGAGALWMARLVGRSR